MKKTLLSLAILSCFSFSFGQITYNSSDFASNGETFQVVNTVETNGLDFVQSGVNHTWDYSTIPISEVANYGYDDPNNSPFKNTWCLYHLYLFNCDSMFDENFNMGMTLPQSFAIGEYEFNNPYQHLMKTDSELQSKMFGANVNLGGTTLPAILEYSDPDVLFQFPMMYNAGYTDASEIDMNFNDLGIDLVVTMDGTRTNNVVGYGELKVRNHTYANTLKVRSISNQNFNIYYEGQHTVVPVATTTYYWFDKDFGIPVFMVAGTEVEGQFVPGTVTYIYQAGMSVNDLNLNKSVIYPNPTSGKLNLKLNQNETVKSIQIYDSSGKLIGNQLDLSQKPKGIYTVKIKTSKGNYSEKIIRK